MSSNNINEAERSASKNNDNDNDDDGVFGTLDSDGKNKISNSYDDVIYEVDMDEKDENSMKNVDTAMSSSPTALQRQANYRSNPGAFPVIPSVSSSQSNRINSDSENYIVQAEVVEENQPTTSGDIETATCTRVNEIVKANPIWDDKSADKMNDEKERKSRSVRRLYLLVFLSLFLVCIATSVYVTRRLTNKNQNQTINERLTQPKDMLPGQGGKGQNNNVTNANYYCDDDDDCYIDEISEEGSTEDDDVRSI